jgi:large subunit ribosomal protein L24
MRVKKGDTVRVIRGRFADKEGKVIEVNLRRGKIYIEGITQRKSRGQEAKVAIDPSNVIITKLAERK